MYLKRIEIDGFKSFASNTVFDFGPGITAIVGPNGCGKSNAADALQWVLGEQHSKLLRARRQEDIIFAGSLRHPQARTAEVSLLLDNSDRELVVAEREVKLTRRAYRTGESAYFINGRRSRLRDIVDLLLKTPAGQGNYVIMGQGLVETILNFRPEERRLLLEEAAGLQGFRAKLEEAEEHLSATNENMARVRLLLHEITPGLSRFETQVRKVEKRNAIEAELNSELRAWHAATLGQAQEQFAHAQADLERIIGEQRNAEDRLAESEQQLTAVRASVESDRHKQSQDARRVVLTQERRDLLEKKITLDEEHLSLLVERGNDLLNEMEALQIDKQRISRMVAEDEERIDRLRQGLTSEEAAVSLLQQQLNESDEEVAERRRLSDAADHELIEARTASAAVEGRLENFKEQRHALDEITSDAARAHALVAHLVSLARIYADLKGQERRLKSDEEMVFERSQNVERLLIEQRSRLNDRKQSLQQLTAQLERAHGHLEAIRQDSQLALPSPEQEQADSLLPAIQDATSFPAIYNDDVINPWQRILGPLTKLLGRRGEGSLVQVEPGYNVDIITLADIPGGIATFAELLQVPAGLEKAITAALADKADALLVQNYAEAIAVAEHIAKQGKARTVLVPIDDVQTSYPRHLLEETGVIGIAASLVRCPEEYRYLVNALLGRMAIVETIDVARRVLRRGIGSVVTRDGIVFHPSGIIESGRGSPIIQQRHDSVAIPRRIRRLQQQIAALNEEIVVLSASIERNTEDVHNLRQRLADMKDREVNLRDALAHCRHQIGRSQGEIRHLIENERAARAALGRSQKVRLEKELRALKIVVANIENSARKEHAILSTVLNRRDALAQQFSTTKAETVSMANQAAMLHAAQQPQKDLLSNVSKLLENRESQHETLTSEVESLRLQLARRRSALERLSQWLVGRKAISSSHGDDIATRESLLESAEADFSSIEGQLKALAEVCAVAEAALQSSREHLESAGLRLEEQAAVTVSYVAPVSPHTERTNQTRIPEWLAAQPQSKHETCDTAAIWKHIEQLRSSLHP